MWKDSSITRLSLPAETIDVDLDNLQIRVWFGKGSKHRLTTLAPELVPALATQIKRIEVLLEQDYRAAGCA